MASSSLINETILRRSVLLVALLCLVLLTGIASSRVYSFDIFWQLLSGKYIVQNQAFIYQDLFSLAADHYRWEHCWLHDVIFYLVYLAGGYAGISLVKGGVVGLTFVVLFVAARRRNSSLLSILLIGLPLVLTIHWTWLARPQIWSYVLFAIFLFVLGDFHIKGGKSIYWLVPLMMLWVNLHKGAIIAFPVIAAFLVGGLLEKKGRAWLLRLSTASGLVSLAALINPYGKNIYHALIVTPTLGPQEAIRFNNDWAPPQMLNEPWFVGAILLSIAFFVWQRRQLVYSEFFLLGGLAFMGAKMERHLPFFMFAATVFLPAYMDRFGRNLMLYLQKRLSSFPLVVCQWVLLCVVSVYVIFTVIPLVKRYGFFDLGLDARHYPVEAASFVKQHQLPGQIFNSYSWGGYLMWKLYPDYLVFWDGRSTWFNVGKKIQYGEPEWRSMLDKYEVNTAIVKPLAERTGGRFPLVDKLKDDPAWVLVHADQVALVFVRQTAVDPQWLQEHRLSNQRIGETIVSAAQYLLSNNGGAFKAYGEMANVFLWRKQDPEAIYMLKRYLEFVPEDRNARMLLNRLRVQEK